MAVDHPVMGAMDPARDVVEVHHLLPEVGALKMVGQRHEDETLTIDTNQVRGVASVS